VDVGLGDGSGIARCGRSAILWAGGSNVSVVERDGMAARCLVTWVDGGQRQQCRRASSALAAAAWAAMI
jgi:hypothetical protein